jgi:hypothetical protein
MPPASEPGFSGHSDECFDSPLALAWPHPALVSHPRPALQLVVIKRQPTTVPRAMSIPAAISESEKYIVFFDHTQTLTKIT